MAKPFSGERLTFRLDILAQEAIRANDHIFQERVGLKVHEVRVLRIIGNADQLILAFGSFLRLATEFGCSGHMSLE